MQLVNLFQTWARCLPQVLLPRLPLGAFLAQGAFGWILESMPRWPGASPRMHGQAWLASPRVIKGPARIYGILFKPVSAPSACATKINRKFEKSTGFLNLLELWNTEVQKPMIFIFERTCARFDREKYLAFLVSIYEWHWMKGWIDDFFYHLVVFLLQILHSYCYKDANASALKDKSMHCISRQQRFLNCKNILSARWRGKTTWRKKVSGL